MGDEEELEKLFFELSSETRLGILRELQKENLRMQEVARRMDVTATEVFRQLQRLSGVSLVQRQPDGAFAITMYGRIVLHLSASFEFVSKHSDYFQTHDVWRLPIQFLDRIGELAQTELSVDAVESTHRSIQIFLEAEEYAWGISEHSREPEHLDPLIDPRIERGIEFRLMVPEEHLSSVIQQAQEGNIEIRGLPLTQVVLVLSEKEGGVFFPSLGGRVDYSGFFGKDPAFLNWVRDLFLHYWGSGRRI